MSIFGPAVGRERHVGGKVLLFGTGKLLSQGVTSSLVLNSSLVQTFAMIHEVDAFWRSSQTLVEAKAVFFFFANASKQKCLPTPTRSFVEEVQLFFGVTLFIGFISCVVKVIEFGELHIPHTHRTQSLLRGSSASEQRSLGVGSKAVRDLHLKHVQHFNAMFSAISFRAEFNGHFLLH